MSRWRGLVRCVDGLTVSRSVVSPGNILRPLVRRFVVHAAVELAQGPRLLVRLVLAPCRPDNIRDANRQEADRNKCDQGALLATRMSGSAVQHTCEVSGEIQQAGQENGNSDNEDDDFKRPQERAP